MQIVQVVYAQCSLQTFSEFKAMQTDFINRKIHDAAEEVPPSPLRRALLAGMW